MTDLENPTKEKSSADEHKNHKSLSNNSEALCIRAISCNIVPYTGV